MMKTLKWIAVGLLVTVGAQAAIVADNLERELNADDITSVANGATWTARAGANATLNDTVGGALTKAAATVDGGQTNTVFAATLTAPYGNATAVNGVGAWAPAITGTTLSVELWIKTGFTGFPATSHTIFETGGSSKGMTITLGDSGSGTNDTLRFALWQSPSVQVVDVPLDAAAMADFTDGDHHQLVVTYDNVNTMSVYIDGALVGENTSAGVVDWDGSSGLGFWGREGDMSYTAGLDSAGYGNGSIAVFRHYSDVLMGVEVLQNYSATRPTYYVGSGALVDVVYDNNPSNGESVRLSVRIAIAGVAVCRAIAIRACLTGR